MGVTLERVQNKFACIIGELCSEPDILSQFAVWVDLRIAEYKAKGAISLDCTGLTPDPKWLKGLKTVSSQADSPLQKGPARLSSGNARHKNQVSSSAQNSSFETTVNPEWSSESHDTESVVVKQEMDHDSAAFPISLHSNHSNSTITVPRKRQGGDDGDISHSDNSIFSSSHPSKSKRLSPHSDNSLSGGGQDSVSNQSFLSVIGVNDQPDQTPQDTLLPVRENSADLAESSEDITITYNDSQVFYHQPATTDPAQTEYTATEDNETIFRARSLIQGCYSGEERAMIGRFAIQHGNTRAAVHYSKILGKNINESTVRSFKKRLIDVAKARNCDISQVASIPSRR
ncbi:uncharacterized protein LOC135463764 isoform X3 [Liolophura sinensis]|uniref:uncharacterized protein LOC135463764 isoform X3 n=1 Tax=Liolophura sinensis TaxID=3198878 RepID=UPI0031589AF4